MDWEVKNLLRCQSKHGLMGSSAKCVQEGSGVTDLQTESRFIHIL